MLALIAFSRIRTGAGRLLPDKNMVDVACGADDVDPFLGAFFAASPRAANDIHPKTPVREIPRPRLGIIDISRTFDSSPAPVSPDNF